MAWSHSHLQGTEKGLGGSAVATKLSSKELPRTNQQDPMQCLTLPQGLGTYLRL